MRAIRARYDPYEQTRGRVEQLKALGHSVDKVWRMFSLKLERILTTENIRWSLLSWVGRL
jgi:hypothetical protein